MQSKDYKANIKVVGAKSKKRYDDAAALGDDEGKAFVDAICHLLDELAKKPVGKSLLKAIEDSGRQVTIFCDDKSGAGSAALPYPGTATNEVKRFVKLRQIPQNALNALKKENDQFITPAMASYAALFHATVERSRFNRDAAAVIMGISRGDFDAVEAGRLALKPEAYHRFAMYFYDHLEAGEGCTVALRFDPDQSGPSDPDIIILAHELIHVWRMVSGMRIFEGGWEEEAMTTGIPPFVTMKYTENKIRVEHNIPLRISYNSRCGTAHYNSVTVFKGVWPEHVRAWEEWKAANPKTWNKPVKVKSKSIFSAPIRNLFNR